MEGIGQRGKALCPSACSKHYAAPLCSPHGACAHLTVHYRTFPELAFGGGAQSAPFIECALHRVRGVQCAVCNAESAQCKVHIVQCTVLILFYFLLLFPTQTVHQVQRELSGNSPDQGVGHIVQTSTNEQWHSTPGGMHNVQWVQCVVCTVQCSLPISSQHSVLAGASVALSSHGDAI